MNESKVTSPRDGWMFWAKAALVGGCVLVVLGAVHLLSQAGASYKFARDTQRVAITTRTFAGDRTKVVTWAGLPKDECMLIVRTFAPGALFSLASSGMVDGKPLMMNPIDPDMSAAQACIKDGSTVEMVIARESEQMPPAPSNDYGVSVESAGKNLIKVRLRGKSVNECRATVAMMAREEGQESLKALAVGGKPVTVDFNDPRKTADAVCQTDGAEVVATLQREQYSEKSNRATPANASVAQLDIRVVARSVSECKQAVDSVLREHGATNVVRLVMADASQKVDLRDAATLPDRVCQHDGEAMLFTVKQGPGGATAAGNDTRAPEDHLKVNSGRDP